MGSFSFVSLKFTCAYLFQFALKIMWLAIFIVIIYYNTCITLLRIVGVGSWFYQFSANLKLTLITEFTKSINYAPWLLWLQTFS